MFFCNTFLDCKKQLASKSFPEELCGTLGLTVLRWPEEVASFLLTQSSPPGKGFIRTLDLSDAESRQKAHIQLKNSVLKEDSVLSELGKIMYLALV